MFMLGNKCECFLFSHNKQFNKSLLNNKYKKGMQIPILFLLLSYTYYCYQYTDIKYARFKSDSYNYACLWNSSSRQVNNLIKIFITIVFYLKFVKYITLCLVMIYWYLLWRKNENINNLQIFLRLLILFTLVYSPISKSIQNVVSNISWVAFRGISIKNSKCCSHI